MNYLHLFEAESAHDAVYNGGEYKEPWAAYIKDAKLVSYNKKEEYVWVTPNTINPAIHDMMIYDVGLANVTASTDTTYDFDFQFEDLKYKGGITHTGDVHVDLRSGTEVTSAEEIPDFCLTQLEGEEHIYAGPYCEMGSPENSGGKTRLYVSSHGRKPMEELIGCSILPTSSSLWYIPWLSIKTKLL